MATFSDWLEDNPGTKVVPPDSSSIPKSSTSREDADAIAHLGDDPQNEDRMIIRKVNTNLEYKLEKDIGDDPGARATSPESTLRQSTSRSRTNMDSDINTGGEPGHDHEQKLGSPNSASAADQYARTAIKNLRRTVIEALMSTTTASSSFFGSFPDFTRAQINDANGGVPSSTVKKVRRKAIAAVVGEDAWSKVENKFVLSGPAWGEFEAVTRALGALEAAEGAWNIDDADARMAAWKQMVSGTVDPIYFRDFMANPPASEKVEWLREQGYITHWTQNSTPGPLAGMINPDQVASLAKAASYIYFVALAASLFLSLRIIWQSGKAITNWIANKLTPDLEEEEATPPKRRKRRARLTDQGRPSPRGRSTLDFASRTKNRTRFTSTPVRAPARDRWPSKNWAGADILKGDLGYYYSFPTSGPQSHSHPEEDLVRYSRLYGPRITPEEDEEDEEDEEYEEPEALPDSPSVTETTGTVNTTG